MPTFHHLKPGDKITRMLAGKIAMPMQVTKVEGKIITCAAIEGDGLFEGDWTFNADNGGEIDLDLGWDPPRTPTGSVLTES